MPGVTIVSVLVLGSACAFMVYCWVKVWQGRNDGDHDEEEWTEIR